MDSIISTCRQHIKVTMQGQQLAGRKLDGEIETIWQCSGEDIMSTHQQPHVMQP